MILTDGFHFILAHFSNLDINISILPLTVNNDSWIDDYYYSFTDAEGSNVFVKVGSLDFLPILNRKNAITKTTNLDLNKEFGFYSVVMCKLKKQQ
jgi:hypothetical protein